jgi:hypothetical protein
MPRIGHIWVLIPSEIVIINSFLSYKRLFFLDKRNYKISRKHTKDMRETHEDSSSSNEKSQLKRENGRGRGELHVSGGHINVILEQESRKSPRVREKEAADKVGSEKCSYDSR